MANITTLRAHLRVKRDAVPFSGNPTSLWYRAATRVLSINVRITGRGDG